MRRHSGAEFCGTMDIETQHRFILSPGMFLVGIVAVYIAIVGYVRRGAFYDPLDVEVISIFGSRGVLEPYHGHLSVVPAGMYWLIMRLFGLANPWPFTILSMVLCIAVSCAMYLTHRATVDGYLSLIGAAVLLIGWTVRDNLLFNFMINFYIPALMLLIAWYLVRRNERFDPVGALAATVVALASSGVGLVVLCAIAVELLVGRRFRQASWYALPATAWLVWYRTVGSTTTVRFDSGVLAYAWHVTVSVFSGFTLGWTPGGLVAAAAFAWLCLVARRRWGTFDAHTVGILAALVALVALVALSRSVEAGTTKPYSPRYAWFGAVLLIAAALGMLRGRRLSWRVIVLAGSVAALGCVSTGLGLRSDRWSLHVASPVEIDRLALVEVVGADTAPDHKLLLGEATAENYQHTVERFGSPVSNTRFSHRGTPAGARFVDRSAAGGITMTVAENGQGVACAGHGVEKPDAVLPQGASFAPGSTVVIGPTTRGTTVRIRRFAADFQRSWTRSIDPSATATLTLPVDGSAQVWALRVDGSSPRVVSCAAPDVPGHP